jgi:lipoate-protein ligase A
MKFLRLKTTDPYLNLAVEEYLFRHAEEDIFMLWQNAPCVVIGKNQNAYAEINMDVARARDIRIVRRITGGGAVYHDLGNLNYTFISTQKRDTSLDFARFCAPIIDALAALGVTAELSGRNDLTVGGKKISGNAQHSADGKTLHHGTLLFDTDSKILSSVLHVDEEKLRAKSIRSVRSRVTNIKSIAPHIPSINAFAELIAQHVMQHLGAEESALPVSDEIDALRARNASREWIFPDRELLSRYSLLKKKRYPFGSVEIALEMVNDTVRDVCIRGDFFAMRPIEELETILRKKTLSEMQAVLSDIDVNAFICGMDAQLLASQILSD